MLYMDDTLEEEDVLMILNDLDGQKSPLWNLFLWRQLKIVVNQLPAPSSRPHYMSLTTAHVYYDQANKLVLIFVPIL